MENLPLNGNKFSCRNQLSKCTNVIELIEIKAYDHLKKESVFKVCEKDDDYEYWTKHW